MIWYGVIMSYVIATSGNRAVLVLPRKGRIGPLTYCPPCKVSDAQLDEVVDSCTESHGVDHANQQLGIHYSAQHVVMH
jgi:hypothetical protein